MTGSAVNAVDYYNLAFTGSIASGTSATLEILTAIDDLIAEGPETADLILSGITLPLNGVIVHPIEFEDTIIINDDDNNDIHISDIVNGAEPSTDGSFRIETADGSPVASDVNVTFQVLATSTALPVQDYQAFSTFTAIIPAALSGIVIDVPVVDDQSKESTEQIDLQLTSADSGYVPVSTIYPLLIGDNDRGGGGGGCKKIGGCGHSNPDPEPPTCRLPYKRDWNITYWANLQKASDGSLNYNLNQTTQNFSDTKPEFWGSSYIEAMAKAPEGYLEGYKDDNGTRLNLVDPAGDILLADAIKLLVESSQVQAIVDLYGFNAVFTGNYSASRSDSLANPKTDIVPTAAIGHWSEQYFRTLAPFKLALLQDENLQMDRVLTRMEMLELTMALYDITDEKFRPAQQEIAFTDTTAQSAYNLELVQRATRLGIINGYAEEDGVLTLLFKPGQIATRAEAIKMMVIAFQACNADFEYTSPLVIEYYPGIHGKIEDN